MKLLLKRKFKSETYTIGDLYINGKFFCNTIEDKDTDIGYRIGIEIPRIRHIAKE